MSAETVSAQAISQEFSNIYHPVFGLYTPEISELFSHFKRTVVLIHPEATALSEYGPYSDKAWYEEWYKGDNLEVLKRESDDKPAARTDVISLIDFLKSNGISVVIAESHSFFREFTPAKAIPELVEKADLIIDDDMLFTNSPLKVKGLLGATSNEADRIVRKLPLEILLARKEDQRMVMIAPLGFENTPNYPDGFLKGNSKRIQTVFIGKTPKRLVADEGAFNAGTRSKKEQFERLLQSSIKGYQQSQEEEMQKIKKELSDYFGITA